MVSTHEGLDEDITVEENDEILVPAGPGRSRYEKANGGKSRTDSRPGRLTTPQLSTTDGTGAELKVERVFSKRTMKDQFGNYPDWMNKRKMRTQMKKNKRIGKRRALSLRRK